MSDGKLYTFHFGKNDFQKKLSIGYLKNFSDDIQVSLISTSELNYNSEDIDFEIFKQYIDFVIYLTPPDINNDNINQFIQLSQDTGSIIVQNYFQKYLDKIGMHHLFLFKLNNEQNEDNSLIEEKIASNLDKYIDQCQNELSRAKITNLSNIFFHKKRKLLNQDAAYDFIVKLGETKKEPNYYLLLGSLDGSLISEERLNDALLNQESRFGFLPKTPDNFLKKLKEKVDEIETKFDEINQQNKTILKKISNIEEMQIIPNQKTDEFAKKIDQVDQQINILQEMKKKDEEMQITFRFLDFCLKEITVNMKSTDHFNTIIEREFDIHVFQLSYKNILIDPYFTLNDYFIPNHSILYVQQSNEHIFIKTNDQNYILYEKNNYSFNDLYWKLQSYSKIDLAGKLKFFDNDQEIGVKKSFNEIENGSVISCSPPLAFIRLNSFENKSEHDLLTINSVCNLPVILTEKIEQIKESAPFQEKIGNRDIFIKNEIILFCNGENLDLNKTFQDYSITDGSEIYYFIKYKSINLEIKEFDLNLSFSTNSLINDVKLKIQEIKGIQIDEQKLFLEHENLNGYSPLYIYSNKISKIRFYHFREGSKLIYLTFYDKFDYSKFVIFLNDDEKLPIKELKQKFYLYKNIPPAPIKIILNNQVLDDNKVLQDYISPLESESKLNFEVQYDCLYSDEKFYILIETLNNRITTLYVKPNAYIYEIRVLLSLKKGLDFNDKMSCNGRYLFKNESTLQDYQITNGSLIRLFCTLRG